MIFRTNIDRPNIENTLLEGTRKCANDTRIVELFERTHCDIEKVDRSKLVPALFELSECCEKTGQDLEDRECRSILSNFLQLRSKSA